MPVIGTGLRNKGQFDAKGAIQRFEAQHGEGSYARAVETSRATKAARAAAEALSREQAAGGGGPMMEAPPPIPDPSSAVASAKAGPATNREVMQYFVKKLGELKEGDYTTTLAEAKFPIGGGSPLYKQLRWQDSDAINDVNRFMIELSVQVTLTGKLHMMHINLYYSRDGRAILAYSPTFKMPDVRDNVFIALVRGAIMQKLASPEPKAPAYTGLY